MADSKNEKIVTLATERFTQAIDAETDNRARAIADIRFVDLDEQWDEATKQDREANGRPCMVINKCQGVVKQISNDARQNKPRIKVRPVSSEKDMATADLFNGIIRNIENRSNADSAYDTGIEQAIKGGWGYWRVVTEYASDDVFEQDIFIRRIVNQFSVYLDPSAKEADKSDAGWCFITEVLNRKEFEDQYPDADAVEWGQQGDGENNVDWWTDDGIRVAEYYYKEPVNKTLWLTVTPGQDGDDHDTVEAGDQEIIERDGRRFYITEEETEQEEATEGPGPGQMQAGMPDGVQQPIGPMQQQMIPPQPVQRVTEILKERKVKSTKLMWCKLAGGEIIEGPIDQAGKYVPVVTCIGDESYIEGEPVYKSAFFHAKDSNRIYNWARSNTIETLALSPKQPYIGTPEMFEGHETEWDNANRTPAMRLQANFHNGQLPQRQPFSISDTGALQEAMQASDDIKATTGLFDASLGAKGNETSGVAINARQRESDTSTFHFSDNQRRAIIHTGNILVDIIPSVFDTERVVRILGEDSKEGWATVNKRVPDPMSPGGYRTENDLSAGTYDVTCDIGPGYTTKRLEALDGMSQFLAAAPSTAPVLLPRIAKNSDWPDADDIADELQAISMQQGVGQDPAMIQQQQQMAAQQQQMAIQKQQADMQNAAQQSQVKAQGESQRLQLDVQKGQQELQKGQQDIEKAQLEIEEQRLKNMQIQQEIQLKANQPVI